MSCPGRLASALAPGAAAQEEKPNTWEEITSVQQLLRVRHRTKRIRRQNARKLPHEAVDGEGRRPVKKPADYQLEDLVKPYKLEDRVYRFRCVEAWSMVIPWQGIPLAEMIKHVRAAAEREVRAVHDAATRRIRCRASGRVCCAGRMSKGCAWTKRRTRSRSWSTGLYGKTLPNQNGAPFRLIVPWKYGFKGVKAIMKISFVDKQPGNTWQVANPDEYGFYANVNPEVDHPRWTQASERRIGQFRRQKTLMFNGYADQVAKLYAGHGSEEEFLTKARVSGFRVQWGKVGVFCLGAGSPGAALPGASRRTGSARIQFASSRFKPGCGRCAFSRSRCRSRRCGARPGGMASRNIDACSGCSRSSTRRVHLSMWAGVDWFFAWGDMGQEIVKHKYILIGMLDLADHASPGDHVDQRLGAPAGKALGEIASPGVRRGDHRHDPLSVGGEEGHVLPARLPRRVRAATRVSRHFRAAEIVSRSVSTIWRICGGIVPSSARIVLTCPPGHA